MSFVPALTIPLPAVDAVDWTVLALTGSVAAVSFAGAAYTVPWARVWHAATRRLRGGGSSSHHRPRGSGGGSGGVPATSSPAADATAGGGSPFNFLWVTRALLQALAALYVLALDLRLQVLWGWRSPALPGGYEADAMCRLYIGLGAGFLEPAFLLLVLFACMYTVHRHGHEPGSNPNLFIFALTVGLTLPMCALQVFAALFSRIMTQLKYHEDLMIQFFAASRPVPLLCPADDPWEPNCAVCLFPAFSTVITAAFACLYLLVLWYVLGRVAGAAVNRRVARRVRALQGAVTGAFCASIALRGASAAFPPLTAGLAALNLANALAECVLVIAVSAILVWAPVSDARAADRRLRLAAGGGGGSGAAAAARGAALTELVPLVGGAKAARRPSNGGGGSGSGGGEARRGSGGGGGGGGSSGAGALPQQQQQQASHPARLALLLEDAEAGGSDSDNGR